MYCTLSQPEKSRTLFRYSPLSTVTSFNTVPKSISEHLIRNEVHKRYCFEKISLH